MQPQAMYLTHYGRIDARAELAQGLVEQIEAMVAAYRAKHCHEPPRTEQYRLAQAATLATRTAKEPGRPLNESVIVSLSEDKRLTLMRRIVERGLEDFLHTAPFMRGTSHMRRRLFV